MSPKLRAKLSVMPAYHLERTECGRPGCGGWFGFIVNVVRAAPAAIGRGSDLDAERIHIIDRNWKRTFHGDDRLWLITRERHNQFKPRVFMGAAVQSEEWGQAIEPDALLQCPKCRAVQALPDGAASVLDPFLRVSRLEIGLSRIRPLTAVP